MKIEPLIGIPSPRNHPLFLDALKKLDFVDRLWAKFFIPEKHAYDLLRNYFLANEQYTHLVILPDDLIVTPEQLKSLIDTVENNYNKYPVFSGVANMDNTLNRDVFAVSFDVIHILRDRRKYSLITRDIINELVKDGKPVKVNWAGFPCMFLRRDVVEKFEFNSDGIADHDSNGFNGCCTDTVACFYYYICDIPIYVDPSIQMLHLKINDSMKEYFYAGRADFPSHAYLEKKVTGKKINVPKK